MIEPRDCICESCVDDSVLKEAISAGSTLAKCLWCHAKHVLALPMQELGNDFRELVEREYAPEQMGEPIDALLFDDWRIFSRSLKRKSGQVKRELVLMILRAGLRPKELCLHPDYAGRFVPKPSRLVEKWVCELERFLSGEGQNDGHLVGDRDPRPDGVIDSFTEPDLPSEFELVLEDLSGLVPEGTTFWRAQTLRARAQGRFSPQDCNAPPPECAPAGRANREGSRFFVASDADTAIAEVRGWKAWPIGLAEVPDGKGVRNYRYY